MAELENQLTVITQANGVPANQMPQRPGMPLATNVAPPEQEVVPLTPTEQLKVLMSAESWGLLQGLLRWAVAWEDVRKGAVIEYSEDNKMVMMAPWTFFGASPATLGNLFQFITPVFMSAYGQYESDEVYARANPMPWIVVQTVAPMFALTDRGHQAQMQVWGVIKKLRATDDLPIADMHHPKKVA